MKCIRHYYIELRVSNVLYYCCSPCSPPLSLQYVAASSGTGSEDYTKLKAIVNLIPGIKYICLDVANGYSEHFVSFVREVRKEFPNHTILVSPPSLEGSSLDMS